MGYTDTGFNIYYIPYCIVPIIIRILFDTRLALNIHLLVVLIAGFFVPNSFEFAYFEITAGMVPSIVLKTWYGAISSWYRHSSSPLLILFRFWASPLSVKVL
jgi:hypothetical protein